MKANPNDVILVAIDAPETPFQTILAQAYTGGGKAPSPAYVPCDAIGQDCEVNLQHSCQNTVAPAFFGDPPVRLNAVVKAAKYHAFASICGDDLGAAPDYTAALRRLGTLIMSNIGQGCIPKRVLDPSKPDSAVNDVTPKPDGSVAQSALSSCDATGGAPPCWKVETKPAYATLSPQGIGITIDRGGGAPPWCSWVRRRRG